MSSEFTPEREINLLEQHYSSLSKALEDLQKYEGINTEAERELHVQQVVNNLKAEQEEVAQCLKEIRKAFGVVSDANEAALGALHHIPELPVHFILNSQPFNPLKEDLLADAGENKKEPVLIEAPVGTGKSTIAAKLAREDDIRRIYTDGIFWVSLGPDSDVLGRQIELFHTLGGTTFGFIDPEEGTNRLRELCEGRACLLILDDVWDVQDVVAFNILGKNGRLLITASDSNLLDFVKYFVSADTRFHSLKPFDKEHALEYLMDCARQSLTDSAAPLETYDIVQACENLPVMLKMTGSVAAAHRMPDWGALLERLQNTDLEFPEEHSHALMQALHTCIEELGEDGEYYLALAVFSDYTQIPQKAVSMLWQYMYQLQEKQIDAFIKQVADKGLLRITSSPSGNLLGLHSFQYAYICDFADMDKLHAHMLSAYRRLCPHNWLSGPNDGYFFEHLCAHLISAGKAKEAKSLLLDFDWLQKRVDIGALHLLINDYELLKDKELELVKQTFYEGFMALAQDPKQLATQLLESLWKKSSSRDIQGLLNQAKEIIPDWIPPIPD